MSKRRRHRRTKGKKPKISTREKSGSISFFLSIPVCFTLGFVAIITVISLGLRGSFDARTWGAFLLGGLASGVITASMSARTFRTFIHELKHAVLVIFTGNRVTDFHVEKNTGHVSYEMYLHRRHMSSVIILAPYFLPLTSFPALMAGLFYDVDHRIVLAVILGVTLAFDICTGIQEIHPFQSDLKRIFGGFLVAGSFLAGFLFMWTAFCLVWVADGRSGFSNVGLLLFELGVKAFRGMGLLSS